VENDSKARTTLIVVLFALLAAIAFGLFWFFFISSSAPQGFGWYLFSFAAGLSMIVLPCTLPLAFVIVPLSMGKGVTKGFFIALAFGLGVAFTLSLYGVFAAILGKVAIGSLGAPLEVVKNWLYFIAGAFAYLFALGELGLLKFRMPSYTGAFPGFIQKQKDVFKALLLGLFLGNIGVGCPHPATPLILVEIAGSGNVFYGWTLFLIHAIGRILPLIFLAILGILGVNALSGLVKHKDKIMRATGWAMVFVAGFILVLGLFSHDWWVLSGMHTYLEEITQEERFLGIASQRLGVSAPHEHGLPPAGNTGLFGLPLAWGTWVMLFLWILPFFWYYNKRKREVMAMTEPEKITQQKTLPYLFWNFVSLSLILVLVFGYVLPNRFLARAQSHDMEHMMGPGGTMMDSKEMQEHMKEHMGGGMMMDDHGEGAGHEGHGTTFVHEEDDVKEGLVVRMNVVPHTREGTFTGKPTQLLFAPQNIVSGTSKFILQSELEIQHEKKIHVIGARKDLTEFFHIHPEWNTGSTGGFVTQYTFKKPGEYKIWSEIKYKGGNHVFGHPLLTVKGETPAYETERSIARNVIVGNKYQVAIDYERLGLGDNEVHFTVRTLEGGGVPLENYLGEKMHLAVISDDLTQFVHAHPESASAGDEHNHAQLRIVNTAQAHGTENGETAEVPDEIHFSIPFQKPGLYKMFAQFHPSDANLDADDFILAQFWVQVGSQPAGLTKQPVSATAVWWRNLLVSAMLIGILGWVVKRYITVKT
jgi:cytochrome c-type biogenesis protein